MMEAAFRSPARTGAMPDWMKPFARTIDAAKKYVVSSTLNRVDWNAERVRGDLGKAVQQLKQEPGNGLFLGGVKLPLALAELGLIDEYEFVVQPRLAGHGPTLFAGLSKHLDLKLVSRQEFGSMKQNNQPVLYIFSGLPGSGKSTLAQRLAGKWGCAYLRIDTIEQSLRDLCSVSVEGEGYQLSYRIAADNLKVGISVVADSCNPIELTRKEWEDVARSNDATPVNIEISCSDKTEHRSRVETREPSVLGLRPPTWPEVEQRQYHEWTKDRIVIDTFGKTADESLDQLCSALLSQQETEAEPRLTKDGTKV